VMEIVDNAIVVVIPSTARTAAPTRASSARWRRPRLCSGRSCSWPRRSAERRRFRAALRG
jgi:hypothetical protein